MVEENDYVNVPPTTGPNRGSKPNVTKRVATGILIAALVLAAIIGIRIVESKYYGPLRNTFEASTETTTVPARCVVPCGAGWELHGTKCYRFSSRRLTWTNSRAVCQSLSGHLVKIESREEQTFVFNKLVSNQHLMNDRFWIGLTDSENEGEWKWTDGSPLDQSLRFWMMEPDNYDGINPKGEDCAAIVLEPQPSVGRSWADFSCRYTQRFICEKEPICK